MRRLFITLYAIIRRVFNNLGNMLNLLTNRNVSINISDIFLIKGIIKIYGTGVITIGKNVKINSRVSANPIGGQAYTSFYVSNKGNLTIGNNVGISNSSIVSFCKIDIEDNVLIGGDCKIYDSDFHSINPEARKMPNDIYYKSLPVTIKSGAFIGAASIILKGVVIGKNSVVGAGSVVTKCIPDNQIWAGNPAKFIKNI